MVDIYCSLLVGSEFVLQLVQLSLELQTLDQCGCFGACDDWIVVGFQGGDATQLTDTVVDYSYDLCDRYRAEVHANAKYLADVITQSEGQTHKKGALSHVLFLFLPLQGCKLG